MTAIVLTLYGLASLVFLSLLFKRDQNMQILARLVSVLCLIGHGAFMIQLGLKLGRLPLVSPAQAVNLLLFLALLGLLPLIWREKTAALGAFFLPGATVVFAFAGPLAGQEYPGYLGSSDVWFPLHVISVLVGEALLLIAAVAAAVYLVHERYILRGRIHETAASMPSLSQLDRLNGLSLAVCFAALSLGLTAGGLWAGSAGIALTVLRPKLLAAGFFWLVLAFCLHQRFALGWRGRRTAVLTLVCLLLMAVLMGLVYWFFPASHGLRLLK